MIHPVYYKPLKETAMNFPTLPDAEAALMTLGADVMNRNLTKADGLPAWIIVGYAESLWVNGQHAQLKATPKGVSFNWAALAAALLQALLSNITIP